MSHYGSCLFGCINKWFRNKECEDFCPIHMVAIKNKKDTYPGGEDQREMDEIEMFESNYCECGEEQMFDEEDTDACFSCGKTIGGYTNANPNGDMEAA